MKITQIDPFSKDERGYVAEYFNDRNGNHLIVFTNKDSERGRHYHKGISSSKDPEILILLSGICRMNWRDKNTSEILSETISAPAKIEVPAYTWHELIAVTDFALLELNSLSEHVADTFYD